MRDHWALHLPDEADATMALRETVIDLESESAVCPACDEPFAPGVERCPGCGLRVA